MKTRLTRMLMLVLLLLAYGCQQAPSKGSYPAATRRSEIQLRDETVRPDPAAVVGLAARARAQAAARDQAQWTSFFLVMDARDARNAGKLSEAEDFYRQALRADPFNSGTQSELDDILVLQGRLTRQSEPLDIMEGSRFRRSELKYLFEICTHEASKAVTKNQYDLAEAAIRRAELAAGADRNIFPREDLNRFDEEIAALRQALKSAREQTSGRSDR